MPSGTFTVLDRAKLKMLNGTIDLDSPSTIKAALATQTWTPTAAYNGTSNDARYSDIGASEVPNGNGYATGGVTVTASLSRVGGTVTYTTTTPAWASSTITAKYLELVGGVFPLNFSLFTVRHVSTGNFKKAGFQ